MKKIVLYIFLSLISNSVFSDSDICDSNYKQSGIKIFGLIYGGDSLFDILCNLDKMNLPADFHHLGGQNFSLSGENDLSPLNGMKFYSPRTLDVNFYDIQLFGIDYEATVTMRYSSGEDKILGLGAMRLDQGRVLTKNDDLFIVGYPFAITFYLLNEPKSDEDFFVLETQKRDLIKSLDASLIERGFNENQMKTKFDMTNRVSFEFDEYSGLRGGIDSDATIWFEYNPEYDEDPDISSAMTFVKRAKLNNISTSSNTGF
ncbi:hypothetical protein N9505_05315 [Candidatus Thioglobus sp.]|nr:hypothetical protein [Candidatus Thioglobus sp.]